MTLRAAVTGKTGRPELDEVFAALDRASILNRVERVMTELI